MRKALGLDELRSVYGRIARRYDLQHALITAGADQRGRRLIVDRAVEPGANVLDCGAGTGTTGLLAARRAGPGDRVWCVSGDMTRLPFPDDAFDVVLSTYSMCPLYDPARGALELYRVTRPGGRIGVAHSTDPRSRFTRWLARRVEDLAWRFPGLSMGCRSVAVLPALEGAGARTRFSRLIGVPLWPFRVFVVAKPGPGSAAHPPGPPGSTPDIPMIRKGSSSRARSMPRGNQRRRHAAGVSPRLSIEGGPGRLQGVGSPISHRPARTRGCH